MITRPAIVALILLTTLTHAHDLRMIPTLGDARTSQVKGAQNQNYVLFDVTLPPGTHQGLTVTMWMRLTRFNNSQLTTWAHWCPEAIQYTNPDLLQGAARAIDLNQEGGVLIVEDVELVAYEDGATEGIWPYGVCTVAGASDQTITVLVGGNELTLGPGEFNQNVIAGPSANVVVAGAGTVDLGVSQTPCCKFYNEIDGAVDTENLGITPESTVTNEWAMCTWRMDCSGNNGEQIYRSDLGRIEAFDMLAVVRTNGACAGYSSEGIYRVGLAGIVLVPPLDVEVFDTRVFPRWLTNQELERIHANGVQELHQRTNALTN